MSLPVGTRVSLVVISEAACPKRLRCKCRFKPHKAGAMWSRWDHYEHDRTGTIVGPDLDIRWSHDGQERYEVKLDVPVRKGREIGLWQDGYPRFKPIPVYFDVTYAQEGDLEVLP